MSRVAAAHPGRAHLAAVLLIVLVAFIWGSTFPLVRWLQMQGVSVNGLLLLRFTIGGVALAGLLLVRRRPVTWLGVGEGLLLGLLCAGAYWLQTDGLRVTTSAKSAFITGLYVLFTPFVVAVAGELPRRQQVIAVVLAAIGLFALVHDPARPFGGWNWGDTETLGSAWLFTFQVVLLAKFARRTDPYLLAFFQAAVVAVLGGVAVLAMPEERAMLAAAFQPEVFAGIAFLGLIATAFALWAQSTMQARLTATEAAVLFSLEPVFAALVAVSGIAPSVQETLLWSQWAGAALLLGAVVYSERGGRRRSAKPLKTLDGWPSRPH